MFFSWYLQGEQIIMVTIIIIIIILTISNITFDIDVLMKKIFNKKKETVNFVYVFFFIIQRSSAFFPAM